MFELWCGDELVAADFGHVNGCSVYIATRFFDTRTVPRKLQLGFVLAFVVPYVLQIHGFAFLDWGGADSSVLMSYKRRCVCVCLCVCAPREREKEASRKAV